MEKAQKKGFFAKAGGVVLGTSILVSNALADIPVPTPDYTNFEAVAGVGLAVSLIVGLAYKAKGFLS